MRSLSSTKQPALRRLLDFLPGRIGRAPLAISAAFAMLIAAGGAQPHRLDATSAGPAARGGAQAYSRFGPRVPVQPDDIVKDGVVIGRDPDPFIRGEMLRHYGVGGP